MSPLCWMASLNRLSGRKANTSPPRRGHHNITSHRRLRRTLLDRNRWRPRGTGLGQIKPMSFRRSTKVTTCSVRIYPPIDEGIEIAPGVRVPKAAANLALNQTVTASGATAPAYGAHLAVDGFINTYWESVNHVFPATLTLDLGAAKAVGKVVLKLPPLGTAGPDHRPLRWVSSRTIWPSSLKSRTIPLSPALENTITISFAGRETPLPPTGHHRKYHLAGGANCRIRSLSS